MGARVGGVARQRKLGAEHDDFVVLDADLAAATKTGTFKRAYPDRFVDRGTGVGISIAANKVAGIRACVCSEPVTAALSKRHNDANVVCFGARIVGTETAKAIVDAWLDAAYEGGRHQRRVDMIAALGRGETLSDPG